MKDAEAFAAKLRILNSDGARRFGDKWEYDVEADIQAYVEIANKVRSLSPSGTRSALTFSWVLCTLSSRLVAAWFLPFADVQES